VEKEKLYINGSSKVVENRLQCNSVSTIPEAVRCASPSPAGQESCELLSEHFVIQYS
jgi:hypothetical protein